MLVRAATRAHPSRRSRCARRLVALALTVLCVASSSLLPATAAADRLSAAVWAGSAQWHWPVAGPIRFAAGFRAPLTPYGTGHRGIDLVSEVGAPVRAPADAVVHFAGDVAGRPVLTLRIGDTVLASFEPVASDLVAGMSVERDTLIGVVTDAPSHCSPVCLHFGVRLLGEYVNPLLFLGGVPWSVLKPWAG